MPVYNVEKWIKQALDSCLKQTLSDIEIICVDDASTDRTREIIKAVQERDDRVVLQALPYNQSPFQARRMGVAAARAPFVLFLDGDDLLAPETAERTLDCAMRHEADLVGFGISVVDLNANTVQGYQDRMQPRFDFLADQEIIQNLLPMHEPAQGQLWRFLFRTEVLRRAYNALPDGRALYRVEDLPVTFLVLAMAKRYVSLPDHLYTYYFRRGGSGHRVESREQFEFYVSGIDSVETLRQAVHSLTAENRIPKTLVSRVESIRLSVIGNILGYLHLVTDESLIADCLKYLEEKSSWDEIVMAATFVPEVLTILVKNKRPIQFPTALTGSVLVVEPAGPSGYTGSYLARAQARYLSESGIKVVVAVAHDNPCDTEQLTGVQVIELHGDTHVERMRSFAAIHADHRFDAIIDHRVLQSDDWVWLSLIAQGLGVPVLGVSHRFPFGAELNLSFLEQEKYLPALSRLATKSRLESNFWALRGISDTTFIPTPPPATPADPSNRPVARDSARPLQLACRSSSVGGRTHELIGVGRELLRKGVNFHLTVLVEENAAPFAQHLRSISTDHGLSAHLSVLTDTADDERSRIFSQTHLYLHFTDTEFLDPALLEARAGAIPIIVTGDLWPGSEDENPGLVTISRGDLAALVNCIASLYEQPSQYQALAEATRHAVDSWRRTDFASVYLSHLSQEGPNTREVIPPVQLAKMLAHAGLYYRDQTTAYSRRRERRLRARLAEQQTELARQSEELIDLRKENRRLTRRAIELTHLIKEERKNSNRIYQRIVSLSERMRKRWSSNRDRIPPSES